MIPTIFFYYFFCFFTQFYPEYLGKDCDPTLFHCDTASAATTAPPLPTAPPAPGVATAPPLPTAPSAPPATTAHTPPELCCQRSDCTNPKVCLEGEERQ